MLRYGYELEYNGYAPMNLALNDPDIQRSYSDGTYNECREVCSHPQDGLTALFLNHHKVVARLLASDLLGDLYTYNQRHTGLHVSVNDPDYAWYYGDFHSPILSHGLVCNNYTEPDGRSVPESTLRTWYHRYPQYMNTRIKHNRVESARGLSTLNPYCFLQYVFTTAMYYNAYRELDNVVGSLGYTMANRGCISTRYRIDEEIQRAADATRRQLSEAHTTYLPIANNARALLRILKETTNDPCDLREVLAICRDTEALSVRPAKRGTFDPSVCELGYHRSYGHRRSRVEREQAGRTATTASA